MSRIAVTCVLLLLAILEPLNCADLTPAARQAFNRYIDLFEAKWTESRRSDRFLWMDSNPAEKSRTHSGEVLIVPRKTLENGKEIKAPGAMIQDWLGAIYLPKTNLDQVRSTMQDYKNYQTYFKPEVTQSKLLRHRGDEFEVFLRLYKKHLLTVVLNTTYAIQYGSADTGRMDIVSRSTRVAEVDNAGQASEREEPLGKDDGFLWALNSYWRFQESDGGVYAECEAISLSRDVPLGLGWALKGLLDRFPKESMENTLAGVKRAVAGHASGL